MTYVASGEDAAEQTENDQHEYTWRILFRKGVCRESGRGVTTLIDVHFAGREILASHRVRHESDDDVPEHSAG